MHRSFAGIFTALLLGFLAGCTSIPAQLELISTSAGQHQTTQYADCLPQQAAILPARAAEPALNPQRIAILNWNVYKGQRTNWVEDFRHYSHAQDIILLQEALLNETLESSLREQQLQWTLNHSFLYGGHETGVLTASRVSPLTSCGLRITEPLIRTPKTTLVQTYRVAGQIEQLMVANIHGINFTLGTKVYAQQLNALQEILERHRGPIILAGDFNNWSEERKAVVDAMATHLQLDAIPYHNHNRTRVFGHTIDHIYYRGLEAISDQCIDTTSSDHNPIQVLFRIPPTPPLTVAQP